MSFVRFGVRTGGFGEWRQSLGRQLLWVHLQMIVRPWMCSAWKGQGILLISLQQNLYVKKCEYWKTNNRICCVYYLGQTSLKSWRTKCIPILKTTESLFTVRTTLLNTTYIRIYSFSQNNRNLIYWQNSIIKHNLSIYSFSLITLHI